MPYFPPAGSGSGANVALSNLSGVAINTALLPSANDANALGAAGTAFADLFLAEGGIINWDSGDATITQTGNDITIGGITTFGLGTGTALTTGTIELGAASDTTLSRSAAGVIAVEGVNLIRSTSGVGTSPTATQTDAVTHSLGRIPSIIRIYGMSQFTSNAAATPTPFSIGIWDASGNRCIYQAYNTAAITTTQAAATSTTFAINIQTGANSFVTGVIQNVGATTFDIAWTETGTAAAKVYMWEAE